jgi:hypothetical protein
LPDPSPVDIHRRRCPRLATAAIASALAPAAAIASATIAAAAITPSPPPPPPSPPPSPPSRITREAHLAGEAGQKSLWSWCGPEVACVAE